MVQLDEMILNTTQQKLWDAWRQEYQNSVAAYRQWETQANRDRVSRALRALKALQQGQLPEDEGDDGI